MSKWIRTSERSPEPGSVVLAYWPESGRLFPAFMAVAACSRGGSWYDDKDDFAIPSHWMPLPKPPQEAKQ